jgi:hypothetical protein
MSVTPNPLCAIVVQTEYAFQLLFRGAKASFFDFSSTFTHNNYFVPMCIQFLCSALLEHMNL